MLSCLPVSFLQQVFGPVTALSMLPRYVNFTLQTYSMVLKNNHTELCSAELILSSAFSDNIGVMVSSGTPLLEGLN